MKRMKKVKKENKKQGMWQKYLLLAVFALIGMVCGILMVDSIGSFAASMPPAQFLISLGLLCVGLFAIPPLQIAVHEAGHLVFGLLTGYRFLSFRVGSFLWLRADGKLRLKRLSLVGTGGQCLMSPPAMVEGRIPYVWYNLGGSLLNGIVGLVLLGLYLLCEGTVLSPLLLFAAGVGFFYALGNGIPLRLGGVDNDGYNALSLGKDLKALRSFWIQLKVSEYTAKGIGLADMPKEWFEVPSDQDMKNSMIAVMGVFATNRLMEEYKFQEAGELIERLLSMDTSIIGLHRRMMTCDKIFCELIGENRREELDTLLDKQQKQFMKQMKRFPSVMRTEYAYALLARKDAEAAGWKMRQFERFAPQHPHPVEIESERAMMRIAQSHYDGLHVGQIVPQEGVWGV